MLSHDEEAALAAMEAQLRAESPDLHALFEDPGDEPLASDPDLAHPDLAHPDIAEVHADAEVGEVHADAEVADLAPTGPDVDPVVDDAVRRAPGAVEHRAWRVVAAAVAAVAATALVTLVAGPNVGGLLGALAFPAVGLYGWSVYGCPGHRR